MAPDEVPVPGTTTSHPDPADSHRTPAQPPKELAPDSIPMSQRRPKRLSDWLDSLGQPDFRKTEDKAYRKSILGAKQLRRRFKFREEIRAEKDARKNPVPPMRPAGRAPEALYTAPIPLTSRARPQSAASAEPTAYPVSAEVPQDAWRRWTVTVCLLVCIVGSMFGVGVFGGPGIAEAAGGAFAPDATLLAPASRAFSIWSVIYVGLIVYTVHQWLPSQRTSKRHRGIGWWVAASMILNCGWILSAQAGLIDFSLVVMGALLTVLLVVLRQMNVYPSFSRLQTWAVDVPFGLYLGWVMVASAGNLATWLPTTGWNLFDWGATVWSAVALTVLLVGGSIAASTGKRGRLSVAIAISWGLAWLIVQRLWGEPTSGLIAFVAGVAMFAVLISAGSQRHRVAHAERLAVRRQWTGQQNTVFVIDPSAD